MFDFRDYLSFFSGNKNSTRCIESEQLHFFLKDLEEGLLIAIKLKMKDPKKKWCTFFVAVACSPIGAASENTRGEFFCNLKKCVSKFYSYFFLKVLTFQ